MSSISLFEEEPIGSSNDNISISLSPPQEQDSTGPAKVVTYQMGLAIGSQVERPCDRQETLINLIYSEAGLVLNGPLLQEEVWLEKDVGRSFCINKSIVSIRSQKKSPFLWSIDGEEWRESRFIFFETFTGNINLLGLDNTSIQVVIIPSQYIQDGN